MSIIISVRNLSNDSTDSLDSELGVFDDVETGWAIVGSLSMDDGFVDAPLRPPTPDAPPLPAQSGSPIGSLPEIRPVSPLVPPTLTCAKTAPCARPIPPRLKGASSLRKLMLPSAASAPLRAALSPAQLSTLLCGRDLQDGSSCTIVSTPVDVLGRSTISFIDPVRRMKTLELIVRVGGRGKDSWKWDTWVEYIRWTELLWNSEDGAKFAVKKLCKDVLELEIEEVPQGT